MSKKSLLFVTWSLTLGGGEAQSTINILNNINLNKYDVDVLEFNHGDKKIKVSKEINFLESIINYKQNHYQKSIFNKYIRHPEMITNIIKKDYDCVIACNRGSTSLLGAFIKAKKRIVWIRGSIENLNYNKIIDPLDKENVKDKYKQQDKIFDHYNRIVAVSDSVYNSLEQLFSRHKDKLVKIYNSVDVDHIIKLSNETIESYLPSKENCIVSVGRLREVKNHKLLIDAMKNLITKRNDTELIIIGEGLLETELNEYIKNNNLEQYVKLVGFYPNPFPLEKKAKIFCLSSDSEGFCLAISEACVLGIPFISTDVGGAQEILKTKECGCIIPRDPEVLANKIDLFLNNQKLYDYLKHNCFIARQRFDVKKLGNQVEDLIDQLFEDNNYN